MKTTFTSQEIAHVWAHQSAPHGKSPGAVSFDGDVIYSYRTAMARHIEHKGKAAIVLNVTTYSLSTSRHQGWINMALHGMDIPVFRVDGLDYGAGLRMSGDDLFSYYVEKAAQHLNDSQKPRIRPDTVEAHKGRAAHALEQAQAVVSFYGLRKKVDEKAIERLATAKVRAEKRERIAQEKRDAEEQAKQSFAFGVWQQGGNNGGYFNPRIFPVAFRVEGEELVSTLGARVPLQAARVAYRFAMGKRGQAWRENGEVCPVGNYRLNAINEQGIVAGCHRIAWAELERLASILA